jgi:hypothetical protein
MISNAVRERLTRAERTRLWLGLLLAPTAWLLAEAIGYLISARSCTPGQAGIPIYGPHRPTTVEVVLVAVLAAAAAAGLWFAIRSGGTEADHGSNDDPPPRGRARFMAQAGVLVSGLLLVGIVFFGLPPLLVNGCNAAR